MQNLTTLPTLETSSAVDAAHPDVTLPPARPLAGGDDDLPPILIADDDQDDVFFVQRLVKKTGVKNKVIAFDDGSAVVNYLTRARQSGSLKHRVPLLLFLDLKMQGLGGFGFLEWAREHKELSPLTIVVLTNSSDPQDMERALELGAHRYLVKYPSAPTFESIIRGVYPQTVF